MYASSASLFKEPVLKRKVIVGNKIPSARVLSKSVYQSISTVGIILEFPKYKEIALKILQQLVIMTIMYMSKKAGFLRRL